MQYEIFAKSEVGSTGINGDVYFISENRQFFLLADGASGAGPQGKVLMGNTCIEVAKAFLQEAGGANQEADPQELLDDLVWAINNRLIQESQGRREYIFGTLIVAMLRGNELCVASIGDSPTYYYDGDKCSIVAQSPRRYEWMISEGIITKDEYEAYITNMHPMMGSCFSTFIPTVVPTPKIEKVVLKPGDIVSLCCDGISDWVGIDEHMTILKDYDQQGALDRLIDTAKARALAKTGYFDDLTVVGLKCLVL